MICPNCRSEVTPEQGRCPICTAELQSESADLGAGATVIEPLTSEDPGTVFEPTSGTVIDPLPEGEVPSAGDPPEDVPTVAAPSSPTSPRSGPLEPGHTFGERYRILELLGLGGMGTVYRAWDSELAIEVAIKVIRPEAAAQPEMAAELDRRFKRELLLAREVTHRNVVRIHDLGEIQGIKYITMTLIDGEELESILKREGRLPIASALRIIRDVLSGLVAAHEAGVVHRDLKPANIMIGRESDEALIMDFGVARSAGGGLGVNGPAQSEPRGSAGGSTRGRRVVGTFEYMSPEQFRGEEVDQRSDLYTAGLILYDMLSGTRRIRSAHEAIGEAERRCKQAPPPLRTLVPEIPEPLSDAISRCLEPDVENRYASTKEFAEQIDRLDDEGNLKPIERRLTRKLIVSAAAVLVLLLSGTWWLASRRMPLQAPESMSILIADFESESGGSSFDGAVEQALTIAMEGAGFINAYPRPNAQRVAQELQEDSLLDESMARLVARREGIDVVLSGTLIEKGSGYRISVSALDAALESEGDEVLAKASVTARSRDEVLPAVGRLASDLRRRLGDTKPESARLAEGETFTASSVEAMRAYALGQQYAFEGRFEDATEAYLEAVASDPEFGRAYAGLAVVSANLGDREGAEAYFAQAMTHIDRMTEREKSRTRGGYYLMTGNHRQAAQEYEELVENYPVDTAGHANLALAYFFQRDMSRALQQGRLAVELNPRNVPQRNNVALYAMYAADFETSEQEALAVIELNPEFLKAYVARAISRLGQGDPDGAREAYRELEEIDERGASFASGGLADLALFEGRNADAVEILARGVTLDEENAYGYDAATKTATLARALLAAGGRGSAAEAAERAIAMRRSPGVVVPAARVLLAAGREERALELAAELGERLEPDPRAYALLLQGEMLLAAGDPRGALDRFLEAEELADMWLGKFALGRAYLELDAFAEALAALDECHDRRGEATSVFLDDRPSYHYFPPVLYYLGRAQEGLGSSGAADSYRRYIEIKDNGDGDPLVEDARRRLEALALAAAS